MKTGKYSLITLLSNILIVFSAFGATDQITKTMRDYCAVPPFIETAAKPNVILVHDFSGSMQFPAYYPQLWRRPYTENKVYLSNGRLKYRVNYDTNKTYYGYFKSNSYYKYNSTEGYWEENLSDACQNLRNDENKRAIGNGSDCISGNLLNFFTMSRIDVSLKALTGGKIRECSSDGSVCLIVRGSYRKVYDENLNCLIEIYPNNYWNNQSQYNRSSYDMKISVSDYNGTCKIGTFSGRWLRIKINPDEHIGVLQRNEDLANYALMVFAGDGRYGEIRYGIHEYKQYGMDGLISKLESELPWYGTPQKEALAEAGDYLKQRNEHDYESNSGYIRRGTSVDPFYSEEYGKKIPCINNAVILISDGDWTTEDPLKTAWRLHTQDLRSDLRGNQVAQVFTLYTFSAGSRGGNAMKSMAAAGGFDDLDGNNRPYNININNNSFYIEYPRPNCNPSGTYNDLCKEWDKNRDGIPDNYFKASDGEAIEEAMNNILSAIVKYNYSGGSVGVLGKRSKENSMTGVVLAGTVLAQPLFYSQKYGINWLGKVYGYWYYLGNSTIREDTDTDDILTFSIDKILEFKLENDRDLVIYRYNVDGGGLKTTLDTKLYDPDDVNYLFELGYDLWQNYDESNEDERDDRKIYFAACEKGEDCLKEFKYNSLTDFILEKSYGGGVFRLPLLGMPAECFNMCNYFDSMTGFNMFDLWRQFIECISEHNDYDKLVKYIRGKDYTGFRTRTIEGKVWKLGDIIYSSPQIVTYSNNESYLFVGANDGMLHVFKLGKLEKRTSGSQVVELKENNTRKEVWAFIPLNVLPYLRFLMDPNYCHLYYVDLSPQIIKTKDNRIILIGGLRLGAATGSTGRLSVNPPGWACPANFWSFIRNQCRQCARYMPGFDFMCSWIPYTPPDYSSCVGLSSYFAIDITDPENPKFMWEFSHPDLGFAYSGPAIINKEDTTYVMFGSGPTNYKGDSNQRLRFFTIKLDNPNLNSPYILRTDIRNGFSGRMSPRAFDYNGDGITDYVFVGYGRRDGNMRNWKGGLLMIDVREDNPSRWTYRKYLADAITPITAKVEIGKCFERYYLYFGTGRWFYKLDNPLSGQKERLYGIPIICNDNGCSLNINFSDNPRNVCIDASNKVLRAWYRELELGNDDYLKERNITDPVVTDLNVVLFTTTEPTSDICKFGGRTRIWALNCATGGAITEECSVFPIRMDSLVGSTLLQLSGGNIEQISLKEIPTQTSSGETTQWFTGTAPESGPGFIKPIPGGGEILLWLEK